MEFFLNPERLWHLAWVIPVIVALFFSAQARRKNALRKLLGASHFVLQDGVPVGVNASPAKRSIRFLLLLICTILLGAAYARPAWKTEIVPFRGAGRDVAIALDLSKSMRSEDIKPSRLIHAKRFISDMTARMKGDRFALVAFAGDAFLSCPLTFDSVSFKLVLDGEQIGSVPVGGTNIERALQVSESAFDAAEVSGHCAIVLVSDGGELTGNMAREAEKLRAAKIPVVVVGVGDPIAASPIPEPNEEGRIEYLKDREGNVVNTRLEEGSLRELAAKTGGIYIRSTLTEMNDYVAAEWIRRLTPAAQEEGMRSIPIERRSWFLIPAIVAFFLFLALGERVRNERGLRARAFKTLLRSAPVIAVTILVVSTGTLSAQEAQEEGKFTGTSAEEYFNEALKAQKEGDSERARKLYAEALAQKNALKGTRTAISQNLGAQLHEDARAAVSQAEGVLSANADEAGKMADSAESNFKRAEEFYRDVLRSGDLEFSEGTAQNERILLNDLKRLEELKKQIEEQKKQQQNSGESQNQDQQQQNSDQNQSQDKQDQQKNSDQNQDQQSQNQQNQNEQNQQQQNQDQQEQSSQGNEEQNQDSQNQKNSDQQDEQSSQGEDQKERDENKASPENKEQSDDQKDDTSNKSSGQQDQSLEHEEKSKANDSKENESGRENGEQPKDESFDDTAAEMVLREMRNEEEERREEVLKRMRGKERQVERDW